MDAPSDRCLLVTVTNKGLRIRDEKGDLPPGSPDETMICTDPIMNRLIGCSDSFRKVLPYYQAKLDMKGNAHVMLAYG